MRMAKSGMVGPAAKSSIRALFVGVFWCLETKGEDGPKIWYGPSKQLQGQPDLFEPLVKEIKHRL